MNGLRFKLGFGIGEYFQVIMFLASLILSIKSNQIRMVVFPRLNMYSLLSLKLTEQVGYDFISLIHYWNNDVAITELYVCKLSLATMYK